jgi:hypothetical protein
VFFTHRFRAADRQQGQQIIFLGRYVYRLFTETGLLEEPYAW